MKAKSLSAILLAALLTFSSALYSCGNSKTAADGSADGSVTENGAANEMTTEYNPYDPMLPELDYEGYVVRFAGRGSEGSGNPWDTVDIVSEEQDGEVLNDAVYERNQYIYETLNVGFKVSLVGETSFDNNGSEMFKALSASIMAGDDAYDVIIAPPYDTTGLAFNGYTLDMNTFDYIDFGREWWDQNAIRQMTANDKIYFATGEITYIDNKATQIMLFVKDVISDYGLEDPYELVRNGVWTLDKLIEMSSKVVEDLDGNGIYNEDDRTGYIYWQDACFGLTHASGLTFGAIGADGTPELTFLSDKMVSCWNKLIDFAAGDAAFSIYNELDVLKGQNVDATAYMVDGKHTLFSFAMVNTVLTLRQIETAFGIIPNPKYDESQENYLASAHGWGTAFVNVPITNSDTSRTGAVLELLAAKSAEVVTPAFYDKTLTGKSIRDSESEEMLDIIFENKVYDIGFLFGWGGLNSQMMQLWNRLKPDIASMYEKNSSKAESDLENTVALYKNL